MLKIIGVGLFTLLNLSSVVFALLYLDGLRRNRSSKIVSIALFIFAFLAILDAFVVTLVSLDILDSILTGDFT